jgi:cysteinyl-tRNA synthetase
MLDDFNTAKAFGYYFKFINNGSLSPETDSEVSEFEETMGIRGWRDENIQSKKDTIVDEVKIKQIIFERDRARKDKNWIKADELRYEAEELGVKLLDKEGKTTWEPC